MSNKSGDSKELPSPVRVKLKLMTVKISEYFKELLKF